jgi:para-aminobenzoate synthetase
VIVEGVSATDVRLPVPWDFTIWIEVPATVRRARIVERDGPALQHRWQTDWIPMEEAYAAAQRPWERVDLVHLPQGPVDPPPIARAD